MKRQANGVCAATGRPN